MPVHLENRRSLLRGIRGNQFDIHPSAPVLVRKTYAEVGPFWEFSAVYI